MKNQRGVGMGEQGKEEKKQMCVALVSNSVLSQRLDLFVLV